MRDQEVVMAATLGVSAAVAHDKIFIAGGAPLQWRVMLFRTAGILPAHDHEAGWKPAVAGRYDPADMPLVVMCVRRWLKAGY